MHLLSLLLPGIFSQGNIGSQGGLL